MWDLPGPGLEPVSPALAGGFLTTAPSGKPWTITIKLLSILSKLEHIVFRGSSPLFPPLLGKVIKLSFSTSPKTLSPRFSSAPVYRKAELSASCSLQFCSFPGHFPYWFSKPGVLGTLSCTGFRGRDAKWRVVPIIKKMGNTKFLCPGTLQDPAQYQLACLM